MKNATADHSDDIVDLDNALILALVAAGAIWYWWQQQQQQAAVLGVDNTFTGDINQVESTVSNYVATNVQGATRGERNNNPGNIVRTSPQIPWQGLSPVQTDPDFSQFTDVLYGIRALHLNLMTMFSRGQNTVKSIVTAWAPPKTPKGNNDTAAYIANVSNRMGVGPTQVLDLTDLTTVTSLIDSIIMQENGRDIYAGSGQLAQAIAMT